MVLHLEDPVRASGFSIVRHYSTTSCNAPACTRQPASLCSASALHVHSSARRPSFCAVPCEMAAMLYVWLEIERHKDDCETVTIQDDSVVIAISRRSFSGDAAYSAIGRGSFARRMANASRCARTATKSKSAWGSSSGTKYCSRAIWRRNCASGRSDYPRPVGAFLPELAVAADSICGVVRPHWLDSMSPAFIEPAHPTIHKELSPWNAWSTTKSSINR